MKRKQTLRLRKLFPFKIGAIGLATLAIGLGIGLSHAAGTATLTLSPTSGSHDINTNFTVTVYENSSDPLSAVEADFTYDASKLQFVSIDTSTSAFDTQYPSSGGGGSVKIARAKTGGGLTGSRIVAVVTFKALTGSGTTTMTFASSSALVRSSDNANVWNGNTTGGTYTLTTPAPASCPAGQTGTPPNCTTPPANTNTNTNTTTPATNTQKKTTGTTNTTPTTKTPTATPDTTAQQTNPDAPVVVDQTELAPSLGIAIKVIDSKNRPVKDAEVTLNKQTVKSDATGIAGFTNVPQGQYTVSVHSVLGDATQKIDINYTTVSDLQEFDVKLKPKKSIVPYILIGGLLFVLAAAAAVLRLTGRFPQLPFLNRSSTPSIENVTTTTETPLTINPTPAMPSEPVQPVVTPPTPVTPPSQTPSPGAVVQPEQPVNTQIKPPQDTTTG